MKNETKRGGQKEEDMGRDRDVMRKRRGDRG